MYTDRMNYSRSSHQAYRQPQQLVVRQDADQEDWENETPNSIPNNGYCFQNTSHYQQFNDGNYHSQNYRNATYDRADFNWRTGGSGAEGMVSSSSVNDNASSSLTLTVQKRDVGKIIGKGGAKIRELQELSGARINVNREGSSNYEADVNIYGEHSAREKAKELILSLVNDDYQTSKQQQNGSNCRMSGHEEVYVPDQFIGKIIGKGGSNIKSMQENSGAQIKISREMSGNDDVLVNIYGNSEQIQVAKKLVDEIVNPWRYESPEDTEEKKSEPINWADVRIQSEEYR